MTRALARALCLIALLLAVSGCSTRLLAQAGAAQPRVEIDSTPFFPQTAHQCGPAALATVLSASGVDTSADSLTREVYVPGLEGSLQAELMASARRHGRIAYPLEPSLAALLRELEHGTPVLVLQNFGYASHPLWHYAVVIGYDRERDQFLLRSGDERRQDLAARRFVGTWERADDWAFIALVPGAMPADPSATRYLTATAALEALGDPAAVTSAYEAAVRRWAADPLAWLALGNNQQALGKLPAAEGSYREVLRLAPSQLAARNNLALLLAKRGCGAEALATLAPARAAAAGGPLAAEIEDSARTIAAHPEDGAGCDDR
jgi:tetratricopeptide (TPR) repeat protein